MVDTLVLGTSASAWEFESLQTHQKEIMTNSRIFRKAESAFELAKIVSFVFWMPIIVLTFLSIIIH